MSRSTRPADAALRARGVNPATDFDSIAQVSERGFDAGLLREPVAVLSTRSPLIFDESVSTSLAMRSMQEQHRGCVLITDDGSDRSPLRGIFTERDVLLRVIDRGRNPAMNPLGEVMTRDPECLPWDARVAWVLNVMSVGGIRHVPIVSRSGCPAGLVSVRDVVEFLVQAFPSEILNLPPDFGVEMRHPRDGA